MLTGLGNLGVHGASVIAIDSTARPRSWQTCGPRRLLSPELAPGWPLERAEVLLRSALRHAVDCESCETNEVGPKQLEREVLLEGPLTEDQRTRLLAIADRCPIKQTLERGVQVMASLPA